MPCAANPRLALRLDWWRRLRLTTASTLPCTSDRVTAMMMELARVLPRTPLDAAGKRALTAAQSAPKPRLVFFQYTHDGLPEFLVQHARDHVDCLSEFFDTT